MLQCKVLCTDLTNSQKFDNFLLLCIVTVISISCSSYNLRDSDSPFRGSQRVSYECDMRRVLQATEEATTHWTMRSWPTCNQRG